MSESLNHSLNRFVQKDSFRNKTCDCCYECVIESFTQLISLKTDSFRNKHKSLVMSASFNYLLN